MGLRGQARANVAACKGIFTRVWGLPCGHEYLEAEKNKRALKLDQFHDQWRLDKFIESEELDVE